MTLWDFVIPLAKGQTNIHPSFIQEKAVSEAEPQKNTVFSRGGIYSDVDSGDC